MVCLISKRLWEFCEQWLLNTSIKKRAATFQVWVLMVKICNEIEWVIELVSYLDTEQLIINNLISSICVSEVLLDSCPFPINRSSLTPAISHTWLLPVAFTQMPDCPLGYPFKGTVYSCKTCHFKGTFFAVVFIPSFLLVS